MLTRLVRHSSLFGILSRTTSLDVRRAQRRIWRALLIWIPGLSSPCHARRSLSRGNLRLAAAAHRAGRPEDAAMYVGVRSRRPARSKTEYRGHPDTAFETMHSICRLRLSTPTDSRAMAEAFFGL